MYLLFYSCRVRSLSKLREIVVYIQNSQCKYRINIVNVIPITLLCVSDCHINSVDTPIYLEVEGSIAEDISTAVQVETQRRIYNFAEEKDDKLIL